MIRETSSDTTLELAARRLERAVGLLEQRLALRVAKAGAEAGGLFDQDRANLAAQLDQARARERELEEAGAEASVALGRAIVEIRAALNGAAPPRSTEAMSQISVEVNGRPYAVGCEDGQEQHLIELAKLFDHQVRQVSKDMGQLGDTRLFLMGALLLADELSDARTRMASMQVELNRMQANQARIEGRAVSALEAAATRIEKLAGD